jgi:hypothetical protein
MQKRIYKKGRPTTGWLRGKLVRKLSDIKVGDILISVCDQFESENLVKVMPLPKGWRKNPSNTQLAYANVNGRKMGPNDGNNGLLFCLWGFELKTKRSDGGRRFFKAIKTALIIGRF